MHRADPFMLDEEIAEEGEVAVPQRPPLGPDSPPSPAPAPVQAKVSEPKPGPQLDAAKPAASSVSRAPGKRGRPKSANPKKQITLRLDAEIVDHFRAKGRGWQTRINSALREAAKMDD